MNPNHEARLFVAVPIPSEIKRVVGGWIDEMKPHLPFRTWVHQEDLHITLQFLGDTLMGRIPAILRSLQDISPVNSPLSLNVEDLGLFGRPNQPSVLWAGVGGDLAGLHNLQQRVSDALTPLGFTPEARSFQPHVTLARKFTGASPFHSDQLRPFPVPTTRHGERLDWDCREVTLYRSHLSKRPMYEAIAFGE